MSTTLQRMRRATRQQIIEKSVRGCPTTSYSNYKPGFSVEECVAAAGRDFRKPKLRPVDWKKIAKLKTVHSDEMDKLALIGEIDGLAAVLNGCYGELSPSAKAYAIQLCHSMSGLKRKLLNHV